MTAYNWIRTYVCPACGTTVRRWSGKWCEECRQTELRKSKAAQARKYRRLQKVRRMREKESLATV